MLDNNLDNKLSNTESKSGQMCCESNRHTTGQEWNTEVAVPLSMFEELANEDLKRHEKVSLYIALKHCILQFSFRSLVLCMLYVFPLYV
jgi:hypothetical protein